MLFRSRGLLVHEVAACTGCGTCAHVCAPAAITVAPEGETAIGWTWFSGSCSYCGLCEQWCPTKAIGFEAAPPEAALHGDEVRLHDSIHMQPCSRCGRLHVPMPEAIQAEMLGGSLSGVAADERELCEDCRRRMTSTRIRDGFQGTRETGKTAARRGDRQEGRP